MAPTVAAGPVVVSNLNQVEAGRQWEFDEEQPMPVNTGLPPTPCLDRPKLSSTNGGSLIAVEITDLEGQREALRRPDLVRPNGCQRCWGPVYVHERRARKLVGHPEAASIDVLIFRCARPECRAVWRVLPKFLARHLWRAWSTVAEAVASETSTHGPVPKQTKRRWRARLRERAKVLVLVLGGSGGEELGRMAAALSLSALRRDVVEAFGGLTRLAELAALVHRLGMGVRVM